jgi:hypothetical protein
VGSGSIGASSFTRTIVRPKPFLSEKPGNWIRCSRADPARDIASIAGEKHQLMRGVGITYRDLVKEYVRLNRRETTYRRVPSGRYINFLSDFMAANPGASMPAAVRAWKTVKRMNSPKDYRAFTRIRD